jgi:hypothetical protein
MRNRPPELVIGDPHDQPGLVTDIPEGMGPVQIVNFYHFHLWPEEKAYCAKCGAHRHRDGYTVELEDGTFALAGSTCGADLWGERWSSVRNVFYEKLHAAGIILDARHAISELQSIRQALEASWRPIVDALEAHHRGFRKSMAPLYRALQRAAAQPDHCLSIDGRSQQYVEGWAYFSIEDVPGHFRLALDQIDAAIAVGAGYSTELGVRTVSVGNARDRLDDIAHVARGLRSFFTQEPMYLHSLVSSVTVSQNGVSEQRYVARSRSVVDVVTGKSVGLPPDYPVLNTEPLRRLRDLKP